MTNALHTPFPLGAFPNTPDSANYAGDYNSFLSEMGIAPAYLDYYGDYTQSISNWISQAQYEANMAAGASGGVAGATPVFAMPLYSNASGSLQPDQQYQGIIAGQEDLTFKGVIDAWAKAGFKSLVVRPGWEMNIPGATYAGSDAQSQANWVKAYQRVYTVMHQQASADGINLSVIWNPSTTNYSNAEATTSLYPGNAYVDAIGVDVYADMYPYSDTTSGAPSYHDWATGNEDTSESVFIANTLNRQHYWNYPAATEWSLDSSGGHSQSFSSLVQFAIQQGKPLAIPETGAGNSTSGTDVIDDPAFPQWLAQQLGAAQSGGEKIDFVNLWDSNGGGNYEWSNQSDGKSQEAAAWTKYFGVSTTNDTLTLRMSEDAYQGDAKFIVSVDNVPTDTIFSASALHSTNESDVFNLMGHWGQGSHTVQIQFLNDLYGGSASTDRNLYVDSIAYDGATYLGTSATLFGDGTHNAFIGGITPITSAPADTLTLSLSEDAWNGDAQFLLTIDGKQVSTPQNVVTLHSSGMWEDFTFAGNFGAGTHNVGVSFINDAWGGTASTDRNLYVNGIDVNRQHYGSGVTSLLSNSAASFTFATVR